MQPYKTCILCIMKIKSGPQNKIKKKDDFQMECFFKNHGPLVTCHVLMCTSHFSCSSFIINHGDHCMYVIAYVNVDIHISCNKDLDRNKIFVAIYLIFHFLIPVILQNESAKSFHVFDFLCKTWKYSK